jgi:hypothetical protein
MRLGRDDAPLGQPSLQKDIFQEGSFPRALALQTIDGGKNVLASLQIGDQFYTDKSVAAFRLYYLSALLVTPAQIEDTFQQTPNGIIPYFQSVTGKKKWLADIPVTGTLMEYIIPGSSVSDGGWVYAVGIGKSGYERPTATTGAVPIPIASEGSAVPKYEVNNPQVSLSSSAAEFMRGRTYRDSITIAYSAPNPLDTFRYVQIFIWNYQNDGQIREGPVFSYYGRAGGQGTGKFFLETDSEGFGTHDVVLFFVALSATFAHRTDFSIPELGQVPIVSRGGPVKRRQIPYVVLKGGILPQMTAPIAPQPTANILGSKVQITWTEINDQTIDHVNIYRANQGTVMTPVSNAQPATPFKIVTKDQLVVDGTNTFLDADFNDYRGGNPQYSPVNPPDDFSVTDPAMFEYWMTAVNSAGMESRHPQSTGVITLRGVDGTDTHPGATYRDNHWNCFWNCQFNSNAAAGGTDVVPGNQLRAAPTDAAGDSYGKWDNDSSGTVGTVPQFVVSGGLATGEVDIFPNTSTNINDFVRIFNDSPRSIFLTDESLVSSVFIGYDGVGNAPSQSIAIGIAEVSGGVQIPGSYIIAYFPGSILNNVGAGGTPDNYTRIVGYGVLQSNVFDHLRFAIGLKSVTAPGGAPTGMIRVKQPMVNGGTEVANWTATVRDQDGPGGGGGGSGGGGTPPGGGGQCAVEGTLIETIDGTVPVEELTVGSMVWSPLSKVWSLVVRVQEYISTEIWSITTARGFSLAASPDHPVAVPGIFSTRRIKRLRPEDKILTYNRGVVSVDKVIAAFRATNAHGRVYMVTLKGQKLYIANGIISHNKDYGHQT